MVAARWAGGNTPGHRVCAQTESRIWVLGFGPRRVESGMTIPAPMTPIAAWPAPPGAPVLLFGGSFDPPHRAHTDLALAARDAVYPDDRHAPAWLVFVPAARSPHKPTNPAATNAQRVEMLRLATADADRVAIWTDEIDRAHETAPSFWADTIERARTIAPDASIRFLIGADQAIAFDRWHAHERILELAEPAVLLRDPCATREAFRSTLLSTGLDPAAWMPRLVETEVSPAASTNARDELARGGTPTDLLDPRVLDYIREHGLYGG